MFAVQSLLHEMKLCYNILDFVEITFCTWAPPPFPPYKAHIHFIESIKTIHEYFSSIKILNFRNANSLRSNTIQGMKMTTLKTSVQKLKLMTLNTAHFISLEHLLAQDDLLYNISKIIIII